MEMEGKRRREENTASTQQISNPHLLSLPLLPTRFLLDIDGCLYPYIVLKMSDTQPASEIHLSSSSISRLPQLTHVCIPI
jgi:hypothetical protein